jgi:peptidoglycan hydrolase CwlO-like protein
MAFFGRKKEDSNARENLPELPGISRAESSLPPLPSFPKTPAGDSLSLNAIKSSVGESTSTQSSLPSIDREPKQIRRMESGDWEAGQRAPIISGLSSPRVVNKEPVFIKIDKFKDVVKKFEDIKSKVEEIDSSLRKIKEVKEKEDAELKSWEQEAQLIKERITAIDDSLFNKI